jgi:hypothetical protein
LDTDAVGVPMGTRQKSATQDGGVARVVGSEDVDMLIFGFYLGCSWSGMLMVLKINEVVSGVV